MFGVLPLMFLYFLTKKQMNLNNKAETQKVRFLQKSSGSVFNADNVLTEIDMILF
jgi:hypothetical protein